MLDTVRLICRATPTREQLQTYWRRREETQAAEAAKCEYYYNPKKDDPVQVRGTYRPITREGLRALKTSKQLSAERQKTLEDQFTLEFSLPKLVFGNNHQMIFDLTAAIEIADLKIAQVPAFAPLPSIADMVVSRLDVCYNYFVGPLLPDYITALAVPDYPHRDKVKINAETVEFRAKSVKCKFYDKFSECQEEEARGILRQETTLHRASAVKAALRKRRGTIHLKDITPDICKAILEQYLRRLGILGQPLGNFDAAELTLVAAYGPSRASRLLHILDKYQRSGRLGSARLANSLVPSIAGGLFVAAWMLTNALLPAVIR
ncbi:MAG: hypothetical protein WCP21_17800 [Armatimonadota bacterium]